MKYSNEVIIKKPVQKVIELFDNTENLKYWQPGLQSFEPISGVPGQPGAKSRIKYKMGKRDVELIETITVRNLPAEFSGTYETKGVWNEVKNYFIPIDANTTKLASETEFKVKGFMKVVALLMPGAFKKQSQKFLDDFKTFAENHN